MCVLTYWNLVDYGQDGTSCSHSLWQNWVEGVWPSTSAHVIGTLYRASSYVIIPHIMAWSIMSSQQDIHFCKELSSSNVMMHTPSFWWWYIIPYISKAKFQAKACQCHYGKSKSKTDVGVLVRFPSSTVLRQVDTGQNLKHQQLLSHASRVAKMCEEK